MRPAEFKKAIGQRIRFLREKKGAKLNPQATTRAQMGRAYSQSDLARDSAGSDVSFTKQQIANYEQGIRTPSPWDAVMLGKLLDASPAVILCLDDDGQPVLSSAEIDMILNFRNLPLDKRADFVSRICELAEAYRSRLENVADISPLLHNTESLRTVSAAQGDVPVEAPKASNPFEELVALHGQEEAERLVHQYVESYAARSKGKYHRDPQSAAGEQKRPTKASPVRSDGKARDAG